MSYRAGKKYSKTALAGVAVAVGAALQPALADITLEEIVVTAQKRNQSIQDIGFSVAAIGAEDAARYAGDAGALAGQIPGVEAYGSGSHLQSFFIRGIGLNEFAGNFNAPVAIHRDEVYVSKNWMITRPSFDIERIEVLKGPQGTLFGRNTTGGAVNYYAKEPTSEFEGSVRLSADEFSRYGLEGAVSGAVAENLQGRLSFYRSFGSGGPQDNLFTGDEHGAPDVTEVRGQLLWDFDNTRIRLLAYNGSDNSETPAYKGPGIFNAGGGLCPQALSGAVSDNPATCFKFGNVTGDPAVEIEPNGIHTINQNQAPERDDSFYGGYLRIEHEFGEVLLTSITAFDQYDRLHFEDSDSTPIASADLSYFNDLEVFNQEIRLTGTAAGQRLNYVAGLFYQKEELRQADSLNTSENPGPLPPRLVGEFDQEVDSIAVFFNADYELSDKLTFTFGGRYTEDKTDMRAETSVGLNDVRGRERLPATTIAVVDALDDSRTDTDFSWRLGLSYNLNDTTLLYSNTATGFRTGGYSVPFGGAIVQFAPEELFSTEVGYKADLSDKLRLNAALFFYQYDDLQVNVDDPVSPIVPVTRNIGESETYGFEADLTWLAAENLEVKLGYSYLDAEFSETDRMMTTISDLGPIPLQGKTPVNSPEHQFNGSLLYVGDINPSLQWSSQVDFRWVDERFLEVTNQPVDTADAYTVVNLSIGIAARDGTWDAALWVKNLTDEQYLTYINNLPEVGFKLDIFGEQRSIGLSAGYYF